MPLEHKVYFQQQPLESFKSFVWKLKGQLFLRLHGTNTDFKPPADLYIEPVYIPLISWNRDGNLLFIDIHWLWRETCRTIVFSKFYPYFWTGTTDQIKLQDIED